MTNAVSRRTVLRSAVAAGAGFALVGFEVPARASDELTEFPDGIVIAREQFRNWDGVITTAPLWTCVPRSHDDVVAVVNWAASHGYTIRPRGYQHTWSPLTVEAGTDGGAKVLLVDTTTHLTGMTMTGPRRVRVEAGARMDTLLDFLHQNGQAVASAPAPGDVTVGGVLAINGHGSATRAKGEKRPAGQSVGTVSNLVLSLTAVVWDEKAREYRPKTFHRSDPAIAPFLTGLGRIFILEVELQTTAAHFLRCQCNTDTHVDELFAAPGKEGARSFNRLLDAHGRVGLIWFAFTAYPWVQTWSVEPQRPLLSRPTTGPYNYPFADNLPEPVSNLARDLLAGQDWLAPGFGQAVLAATRVGLLATGALDMWGPAKDFIHFVKPTTLRVSAGSHAVLVARADVQRVVHEFGSWFQAALDRYRDRGKFPLNSCVEIRVTGIDDPREVDVPGAVVPAVSAARPVEGRPELDTVVWLDALTLPGTRHEFEFFAELEKFLRENYRGWAVARPEWAKRWGTTAAGPWTDREVLRRHIPAGFPDWDKTVAALDRQDPHRLFTSPLLDRLMPPK